MVASLVLKFPPTAPSHRSTLFDTGKHGVGGRMATRASGQASLRSGTGTLGKPAVQLGGLRYGTSNRPILVTPMSEIYLFYLIYPHGGGVPTCLPPLFVFVSLRQSVCRLVSDSSVYRSELTASNWEIKLNPPPSYEVCM